MASTENIVLVMRLIGSTDLQSYSRTAVQSYSRTVVQSYSRTVVQPYSRTVAPRRQSEI